MGMRRFKALVAALLSAVLLLASMPQALAASGGPISQEEGIALLREYDIVRGDETGNLQLESPITRAEMAAIVVRAMGMESLVSYFSDSDVFTDVEGRHEWAKGYVALANRLGLVKGRGGGIFDPGADITYAEAYTIFLRMLQREPSGPWNPVQIVNTARSLGIAPTATDLIANLPAIRGPVFGALANTIAYVTLPTGKTLLQTYVDPIPPTLVVNDIPSPTTKESVVVSGTVSEPATVTVNGKTVATAAMSFSTTVELQQGDNTITVVATDRAGNVATKTVTVRYNVTASRIEVWGTTHQVEAGKTITVKATAYTADGQIVPAEFVTATVEGGIGTYDIDTGTFTASTPGEGAIVFTSGSVTERYEITVIDPRNVPYGLRIRFANEDMPYFIEKKESVILVEVIDKDGNLVAYDNGRKITLDADGDVDVIENTATTREGVAIFRVKAGRAEGYFEDDEVVLEASASGLKDGTLTTWIATQDHIVLVPAETSAPADGKSKVRIRAYLRDKNGKNFDNDSGANIEIELDWEADEADLTRDVITIMEDREYSDSTYVIAGEKAETVIVYAWEVRFVDEDDNEIDPDDDYEGLSVIPAVITFYSTEDEAEDDDEDEDEYDGYFVIDDVDPEDPEYGDLVEIVVKVYDNNGNLIEDEEIAFQVKVWIDGEELDEDLLADLGDKFRLTIYKADNDYYTVVYGIDDAVKATTFEGEATLFLFYEPDPKDVGDSSRVKLEIIGVSGGDAYGDFGKVRAKSGKYFKTDIDTIKFVAP